MAGELLATVPIEGRVVTADTLYCQKRVCGQVIDEGGDYLLVIKRNRKDLYEDVELCFERPVDGQPYHYAEM